MLCPVLRSGAKGSARSFLKAASRAQMRYCQRRCTCVRVTSVEPCQRQYRSGRQQRDRIITVRRTPAMSKACALCIPPVYDSRSSPTMCPSDDPVIRQKQRLRGTSLGISESACGEQFIDAALSLHPELAVWIPGPHPTPWEPPVPGGRRQWPRQRHDASPLNGITAVPDPATREDLTPEPDAERDAAAHAVQVSGGLRPVQGTRLQRGQPDHRPDHVTPAVGPLVLIQYGLAVYRARM